MEWRIRQRRGNNLPQSGEIIRYGEVIGYAVHDVAKDSWINKSTVTLLRAPPLNPPPRTTKVPEPLPPLEDYTFESYRSTDGSVGTRNLLGVTISAHCMVNVVSYVVKVTERNLLPKYPSTDGVIDLGHLYGCGVAINASTVVTPIRTVHDVALNPNFNGKVVMVGLGCEKLQPWCLQKGAEDVQSIPVDRTNIVRLQDEQRAGFKSVVDDIPRAAAYHSEKLNQASAPSVQSPSWWWACIAMAATRPPTLPLTPLSTTPPTY